jgi:adenylosuccinate synthase
MKPALITGLQWGDEGKGKIIDLLAAKYDVTIRFNGGNNAGHTVKVGDTKLHFKLMPSAALHGKKVLIAQAVVINPKIMLEEIAAIGKLGLKLDLGIDPRCHVVLPYHQALDGASEAAKGKAKTGSLGLGIGFAFEDRTNRAGLRMEELVNPKLLREKLKANWDLKKRRVVNAYGQKFPLTFEKVYRQYTEYGKKLKRFLLPVAEYTVNNLAKKNFLFESAQGFYLDFAFGTYPYTVAYHTLASSALPDIGLPPMALHVIGIAKAYTTRVGNGPFPTELTNKIGEHLQTVGHEFGTVSGRKRRCGWFDLPMVRQACRLSGVNEIVLTKLDVLTGLRTIRVKTDQGYVSFAGWSADITAIKKWQNLPAPCKKYVLYLEKHLVTRIKYVSVGPDRQQTIRKP